MIDQYKGPTNHPGDMPVRVLVNNVIKAFENVNPVFKDEVKEHYERYGLKPGLPYIMNHEPLSSENEEMTPYADRGKNGDKTIVLSETFLSYIWCITYALTTFFHEFMYVPSRSKNYLKMDIEDLWKACHIFEYGISLVDAYTEWDKSKLINPECFEKEDEFLIGMANHAFTKALTYILCHEFSHIKRGHLEDDKRSEMDKETEAEKDSFKMIISGISNDCEKFNTAIGTIAGICCLMFFGDTMDNEDHPDSDTRILWFFELLELDPNDALWGIPCIAYRFWDIKNHKDFDYSQNEETYKDLFLYLYEQERKKRKL